MSPVDYIYGVRCDHSCLCCNVDISERKMSSESEHGAASGSRGEERAGEGNAEAQPISAAPVPKIRSRPSKTGPVRPLR